MACGIHVGSNPPELQVKGERILTDANDDNPSGLASGVQEPPAGVATQCSQGPCVTD